MKKILAIAACAALAASALAACDARDGRINDGTNSGVFSSERRASEREQSRVESRIINSDVTERTTDVTTDRGVLHETASMIGDVGEDIVEGVDNIGSSVASNVSDALHDDEYHTDNLDNM